MEGSHLIVWTVTQQSKDVVANVFLDKVSWCVQWPEIVCHDLADSHETNLDYSAVPIQLRDIIVVLCVWVCARPKEAM